MTHIGRGWILLLLLAAASVAATQDDGGFDLDGDCHDSSAGSGALRREMRALAARNEWDGAVDAGKRYVLDMCHNSYRWGALLEVLLQSPRRTEALDLLWEMKLRDLDFHRAEIDWKAIQAVDGFSSSEIGKHYERAQRAIRAITGEASKNVEYGEGTPPYWADDVCPGEYCGLGKGMWVEAPLDTFDRPGGEPVGRIDRCEKVDQIRTRYESPMVPHVVVFDQESQGCYRREGDEPCGPFNAGEVVYYVIYEGEGFVRILHRGEEKIMDNPHGLLGECAIPSARCWLTPLVPTSREQSVIEQQLWILVETSEGSTHWVRDMKLYDGYVEVDPSPEYLETQRALERECSER